MARIQVRRGGASVWTATNPILAAGEFGYETDTGAVKIGDGTTAWTSLGYMGGGSSTLATLTDVNLGTPANNDALTYDSASGKWVAEAVQGGSGLTQPQVLARGLGC
jgi:hypothetical protein